ncbi:MAG: hypothetical protein KGN76_10355 [Acidobacteriota bacterium]|nr:hypothetical protein [Acidobacteriota bacterium]
MSRLLPRAAGKVLVLMAGTCMAVLLAGTPPALAQSTPRSAMATQNGWTALNAGRLQEATDDFRLALQDDRQNPSIYLGAGLAAYLLHQDDEARQALRQALALDPTLAPASQLLAEVLYHGGDLQGAIDVYQRALALTPGNADLEAGLDRLRRESDRQQRFHQALSNHFTIRFEGPAEQALADRALEILERAYWRVGTALDAYPNTPVTVVLYTAQQFEDVTRAPGWAAGAYDGSIRVPVHGALDHPGEFERVLTHEYTHALVHSLAPSGVPMWLNEGLAVCFEPDGRSTAAAQLAKTTTRLPLTELANSFAGLPPAAVPLAYAESAAAVGELLDRAGGAGLANLLRDLGAGVDFATAFERRLQISWPAFQAEYDR